MEEAVKEIEVTHNLEDVILNSLDKPILSPALAEKLVEYCDTREEITSLTDKQKALETDIMNLMRSDRVKTITGEDRSISLIERNTYSVDKKKYLKASKVRKDVTGIAVTKTVDKSLLTDELLKEHGLFDKVCVDAVDEEKVKTLIKNSQIRPSEFDEFGITHKVSSNITMRKWSN